MSLTKVTFSMVDGAYTNVKDYGAVGDNLADDTNSIMAAVAVAVAEKNTLFFPPGTYLCNSVIGAINCSMLANDFNNTTIKYTGVAADFINFGGKTIENLTFAASNASHAAYFTETAASFQSFNNCRWLGPTPAVAGGALLYMNGAINVEINGCFFVGHAFNVIGADGGGGPNAFCNGVGISNTLFAAYNIAAVANGGQGWSFDQVLFEHGSDNLVHAIWTDLAPIWYGTSFTGCWFGDHTGLGPDAMIKWKGNGLSISGCYINGSGYLDTYIVELTGPSKGISIVGNYCGSFAGILDAGSYGSNVIVVGNNLNPSTIEVNGTVGVFLLTSTGLQIADVFYTPQSLPVSGTTEGQTVYDSGTKTLYCWNGTIWKALY